MEYVLLQEPTKDDDEYKAPQIILRPKETEEDCEKIVCDYLRKGYIYVGKLESALKIGELMSGFASYAHRRRWKYMKAIFESLEILNKAVGVEDEEI
jgi:protein subunit release factor A